ncbi:pectate lyase [Brevundimonas sp.]|uniref:pectate lyase n=1 Tax=Brevundimonas sp. TaxID=1871086 RepID=UPI00286C8353|nr:pectate lyase [Brevundimonas sp.]
MIRSLFAAMTFAVLAMAQAAFAQAPTWNSEILHQDAAWYGSPEALHLAETVILHQSPEGGWPKNTSLDISPAVAPVEDAVKNTFDNEATTLPMAFLARVISAAGRPSDRAAFDRGLDYVLAAQYPNGGWPQFYPLREGYYTHITFNDDAMVRTLTVLRDVARGAEPYAFVDAARRARASAAVDKGIQVILATQVRQNGVLTVWCAQHDERTLEPAWARRYEPPSLSGSESVGLTRFLMSIPDPSLEVVEAIEGAVLWFRSSAIENARIENFTAADGAPDVRLVQEAGAGPVWARFYELGSSRPIFLGRESIVRYDFAEIERERRTGYRYFGTWAQSLITEDYPAWRRRNGRA